MLTRECPCCKIEKPLNLEYFTSNKQRSNGFSYSCKKCRNKKRINEYTLYYKENLSKKQILRIKQRNYTNNTLSGRATTLLKAYKKSDFLKNRYNNLDKKWFIENILEKQCNYCGTKLQLGADRIDNNKGHEKINVIPCCSVCNSIRSDIFTTEEMLKIGNLISQLRQNREILKISGNKRKINEKII